jgi:Arabinogalactan endo-1,4-beta-galactosidase
VNSRHTPSEDVIAHLPKSARTVAIATSILTLVIGTLATGTVASATPAAAHPPEHGKSLSVRGADISFTLQEEAANTHYRDLRGRTGSVERILAGSGGNYVRLRVWTDPPAGYSTLDSALTLAKRAKRAGLKVLLDLHYSDFWADPGKQPTPKAWQGQDLPTLAETVREYTRHAVAAFARQGTPVDMVQVGNEVTSGMLFPTGQLYPENAPQQWPQFATLLKAGIRGAHEGAPRGHQPRIMIHIDRGGDNAGSQYFFDHILAEGVDFDVIGESYYPIWHGSLADMQANLNDLATRYNKDIVIVETAYPWTTQDGDGYANLWDGSTPLPDQAAYPPTVTGQAAFFEALRQILLDVPGGHGLGFFDWEPEWTPGVGWEPGAGNPNDNLTMFDFTGRALPSLRAFRPAPDQH